MLSRISLPGRFAARLRAIDWSRRDLRDGVVIFGLAVAVYACAHFGNLPPKLFEFAIDNADYEIDDFIFVAFIASGKLTCGTARSLASASSKKSRLANPARPAIRLLGNDCTSTLRL